MISRSECRTETSAEAVTQRETPATKGEQGLVQIGKKITVKIRSRFGQDYGQDYGSSLKLGVELEL